PQRGSSSSLPVLTRSCHPPGLLVSLALPPLRCPATPRKKHNKSARLGVCIYSLFASMFFETASITYMIVSELGHFGGPRHVLVERQGRPVNHDRICATMQCNMYVAFVCRMVKVNGNRYSGSIP